MIDDWRKVKVEGALFLLLKAHLKLSFKKDFLPFLSQFSKYFRDFKQRGKYLFYDSSIDGTTGSNIRLNK